MSRSRERFPLREEERRRARFGTLRLFAGIGAAALVVSFVAVRLTAGPVLSEFLLLTLPASVPILLVLGAGLWVRLRPRHYVEVDAARGMVTIFRDGEARRRLPLSGIGPLRQSREERLVEGRNREYLKVTFHVARSGPLRELCLHASQDEAATRRVLEARAKAWNLPYETATRETRTPEELDLPVHDRLASDEAARTPVPQTAGSTLTVTWDGSGYDIATSWVPPFSRKKILWMFLAPAGTLLANFPVLIDLLDPEQPALYRGFLALLVVWLLGVGPYEAVRRWLRIHRPPVVRISSAGFEFRGKTIPLPSIEDVVRAPDAVCRVVSDERIVEVEGDFCEPSERDWLRHEIRRLVIEFGTRAADPS